MLMGGGGRGGGGGGSGMGDNFELRIFVFEICFGCNLFFGWTNAA